MLKTMKTRAKPRSVSKTMATRAARRPPGENHATEDIRDAVWRTDSAALKPFRADRLVVCGMGGSAVGGDLARGIIGDRLEGPLEVVRDELLPGWMGPDTAVLASSYSGNTSETLSAFRDAGRRGLHRWAVTTGGEHSPRRHDERHGYQTPDGSAGHDGLAKSTVC
jgi:glucose-6-phosphate isomerase